MKLLTAPAPPANTTRKEAIKDLFYQAGLFTVPQLLKPELCAQLQAEICQPLSHWDLVISNDNHTKVEQIPHRTNEVQISSQSWKTITEHLIGLKPQLEQHFQTELSEMETPHLLRYYQGDFFSWYIDTSDRNSATKERKVLILVYLNGQEEESSSDGFIGGELEILIPQEEYKTHCLQLSPKTGLSIAFDSRIPHQIHSIVGDTRYVIATFWK